MSKVFCECSEVQVAKIGLLRSVSSDFTAKARYGDGEESAEMRIDTTGLFNLYTRFIINKKSSTVE